MDCKFVEHSISDYLGGDLPTQQALELEAHLRGCPDCQALHGDFRELVTACRALPHFEAREDLWHSLRHRLSATDAKWGVAEHAPSQPEDILSRLQRKLVFYQRVAYAAVSVALAMALLWGGQFLYQPQSGVDSTTAPAELAALEIRRAELHYQNAIDSLTQILDATKADWSDEIRGVVEKNLLTIDKSIAECRTALRSDPRNLDAEAYLLAAYRKKVDFLKSVLDQTTI